MILATIFPSSFSSKGLGSDSLSRFSVNDSLSRFSVKRITERTSHPRCAGSLREQFQAPMYPMLREIRYSWFESYLQVHFLGMVRNRSQLNINIQPELLEKLKVAAIRAGKTITEYVSESIANQMGKSFPDNLNSRILLIEERIDLLEVKLCSLESEITPLSNKK